MAELPFRAWLAFSIEQARYNRDALDPKAADLLTTMLERYDALSTPAQAEPVADDELARGKDELRRLMDVIWRSEFRTEAPNWKPLDDLPGMVSQIDNMYAGVRAQRDQARWDLHNPPAPTLDREAIAEAMARAILCADEDIRDSEANKAFIAHWLDRGHPETTDTAANYYRMAQAAIDAALPMMGQEGEGR